MIAMPASSGHPPSPLPSEKKLGKRPMTDLQLRSYYAKLPKTLDYDSDYERESFQTSHAANTTNVPGLQLGASMRPPNQTQNYPVDVSPEDEHARDLLEALYRTSPTHTSTPTPGTPPVIRLSIGNLYDNDDDSEDPGRLVPDPFLPDDCPRITAAERDAIVQAEQDLRAEYNAPLPVRDARENELWIAAVNRLSRDVEICN